MIYIQTHKHIVGISNFLFGLLTWIIKSLLKFNTYKTDSLVLLLPSPNLFSLQSFSVNGSSILFVAQTKSLASFMTVLSHPLYSTFSLPAKHGPTSEQIQNLNTPHLPLSNSSGLGPHYLLPGSLQELRLLSLCSVTYCRITTQPDT